jgi:tRNA(Ile)-lysidine synthase
LLADLPRPILRELIRAEIRQAKGDLQDITFEQIEAVADAITASGDFTITLTSGDIYAQRKGNAFRVFRKRPRASIAPFEIEIPVPGLTEIESVGVTLRSEFVDSPRAKRMTLDTAMIDADCVTGALVARNARPGDRVTPFGMTGSKKLQDVFVDKKIPKTRRDAAIVVVDEERVLWVVGVVASEACRITEKTTRAIRLAAEHDR